MSIDHKTIDIVSLVNKRNLLVRERFPLFTRETLPVYDAEIKQLNAAIDDWWQVTYFTGVPTVKEDTKVVELIAAKKRHEMFVLLRHEAIVTKPLVACDTQYDYQISPVGNLDHCIAACTKSINVLLGR